MNVAAEVFSLVNREVWIVTAMSEKRMGGLTATWVSEASIDRDHPVVLIGIAPNHFTAELIDSAGCFALHLLRQDQTAVALNFAAGSGRERDKFAGLRHDTAAMAPLLEDCLAWLTAKVFARLQAGDRIYYWAEIVEGKRLGLELPLSEQGLMAAASKQEKQQLKASRQADIAIQRPLVKNWRETLPEYLRVE